MIGSWTEETTAYAGKVWLEGLSAEEVRKVLRTRFGLIVTRSAVIGKMYRSGFHRSPGTLPTRTSRKPPNPNGIRAQRHAREVRPKAPSPIRVGGSRVYVMPASAPLPTPRIEDIESPNAAPFMDARGGCKWPIGEGLATLSCCNPIARGSYCEGHAAVSYAPTRVVHVVHQATYLARYDRIDNAKMRVGPGGRAVPASVWDEGRAA